MKSNRQKILNAISTERDFQDAKLKEKVRPLYEWIGVLSERLGLLSREVIFSHEVRNGTDGIERRLRQLLAVGVAFAEDFGYMVKEDDGN